MRPNEILAALMLKERRSAEIARKFNVSKTMINRVIYGHSTSRRIQEEIADILEKPVSEIWPGRAA